VNAQGRFHKFQTRQRETGQRETETHEAEELVTQARIAGLEQELVRYREAFSFYELMCSFLLIFGLKVL
jgi:hypothetical protein